MSRQTKAVIILLGLLGIALALGCCLYG